MKFQLSEYDMVSVLHYLFTANKGNWHKLIKPALVSAAFCVFVGIIANNTNVAIGAYITAGIMLIVIPVYNYKKTIKGHYNQARTNYSGYIETDIELYLEDGKLVEHYKGYECRRDLGFITWIYEIDKYFILFTKNRDMLIFPKEQVSREDISKFLDPIIDHNKITIIKDKFDMKN